MINLYLILNKMSIYALADHDLYNLINDFAEKSERYDRDPFCMNTCILAVDYFKQQAKEMIKSE